MTEHGETPRNSRQRGRGRRRAWPILLAILVVVAAIAVVGDRVAAQYATRELRAQVVAELSQRDVSYRSIDVTIGGFPFLAQVAQGNYDEITIEMTDVQLPADTGGVVLEGLHVVATGVDADMADMVHGTAKVSAAQVTGTAVASFATLEHLIDYSQYGLSGVDFAESAGGLRVAATATVSGVEVPISATGEISVVDGQFRLRFRDVEAVNLPVPPVAQQVIADLVEQSVSAQLPPLPFGLSLDDVRVVADGLTVTATGRDVALVR